MSAPMKTVNLSADLLRTFVTVIDLGGFTKAGENLGRTQPAISLQIRRLEELVGVKLIDTVGKQLRITSEGEILSVYARQILSLNDEAASNISHRAVSGVLRVGLPTDYAASYLQGFLTEYAQLNPEVRFEILCDLSNALLDKLRQDDLDIVIAMTTEHLSQFLARAWIERPIWVAAKDSEIYRETPTPLIVHKEGCEYRNRMIEALQAQHRPWRIAYSSPGISSLQNAIEAGFGVSALTRRTLTHDMRILDETDGYPALTNIRVGLYYKHSRQNDAGLLLVNHLVSRLDQSTEPDFKRLGTV